jgi:pimeloyl-ACP methyl ester carboxylesterase
MQDIPVKQYLKVGLPISLQNTLLICTTAQFCDPQLRKHFNLIAIDMRGWGLTEGPMETESYSPADSADDVCEFLVGVDY